MAESKKARRQKNIRKFFASLSIFLFLFFYGFAVFLFHPYFKIKNISVEGNFYINSEKISSKVLDVINGKHFKMFPKSNFFLLPEEEIIKGVFEISARVENISLEKKFPDILKIKIQERKPSSLFCVKNDGNDKCAFMDEEGFVFEESPYFSGDVFLKFFDDRYGEGMLETGKNILSAEQMSNISEFKVFCADSGVKISEIALKKDGVYEFLASEGWRIFLNERNEPKIAFENLKTALDAEIKEKRKNLDYIDLRVSNKVFYKFKE